jgi:hypothetical protein
MLGWIIIGGFFLMGLGGALWFGLSGLLNREPDPFVADAEQCRLRAEQLVGRWDSDQFSWIFSADETWEERWYIEKGGFLERWFEKRATWEVAGVDGNKVKVRFSKEKSSWTEVFELPADRHTRPLSIVWWKRPEISNEPQRRILKAVPLDGKSGKR